jgi:hypothetical protein
VAAGGDAFGEAAADGVAAAGAAGVDGLALGTTLESQAATRSRAINAVARRDPGDRRSEEVIGRIV